MRMMLNLLSELIFVFQLEKNIKLHNKANMQNGMKYLAFP